MYYCLLRDKHIYKKIIRIDFEHVYMLRQVYQGLCLFIILYFGISKVIPSITQGKRVGLVTTLDTVFMKSAFLKTTIIIG